MSRLPSHPTMVPLNGLPQSNPETSQAPTFPMMTQSMMQMMMQQAFSQMMNGQFMQSNQITSQPNVMASQSTSLSEGASTNLPEQKKLRSSHD